MYHLTYDQPLKPDDDSKPVTFEVRNAPFTEVSDGQAIQRLSAFLKEGSVFHESEVHMRHLRSFTLYLPLPTTSGPTPEHLSPEECSH